MIRVTLLLALLPYSMAFLTATGIAQQTGEGDLRPPASENNLSPPSGDTEELSPVPGGVVSGADKCSCGHCLSCSRLGGWANHWGDSQYFHERPFGSFVIQYMQMQVFNGLVDQTILYEYDFFNDGSSLIGQLNRRGQAQLRKVAEKMQRTGMPIVVQESVFGSEVDEARRQHVLEQLAEAEIPASDDLVVVARVPIVGIGGYGERDFPQNAVWDILFQNRLQETQNRGSRQILPNVGITISSQ